MSSENDLIGGGEIEIVPISAQEAKKAWAANEVVRVVARDASYQSNSGHYVVGGRVSWVASRCGGDLDRMRRRTGHEDVGFSRQIGGAAFRFLEGLELWKDDMARVKKCDFYRMDAKSPAAVAALLVYK